MSDQYYTLTLKFAGPFITQASGTLAFGSDTAMLRDSHGNPALNGSLIRGNLRETLQLFAEASPQKADNIRQYLEQWLGEEGANDDSETGFVPRRGNIRFDFQWKLQGDYSKNTHRTRIKLDAESGTVEEGALQVIEDCFPLGKEAVFAGNLHASFKDATEQRWFQRLMEMALDYIPAMGSFKGIGFGKLTGANLEPVATPENGFRDDLQGNEDRVGFEFTLDRPFCLGKPRTPDSNRLVSGNIISGNVIKALLANVLGNDKEKLRALRFDQWQVTHCLPMPEDTCTGQRKHDVIPLSITQTGKDGENNPCFGDMASTTPETYWQGEAPAFQPDWKYKTSQAIRQILQLPDKQPARQLVIRTGIHSPTQTAAQNQLFSMECVIPDGFVWRGDIDLSRITDKGERKTALSALREAMKTGLHDLGKTKASLQQIRLQPKPFAPAQTSGLQQGQRITLTLLTAARLFPLGWERNAASHTARQLYQDYWKTVSDGSLQLNDEDNFFAQQERHGGAYHYHRFQLKQHRKDYAPEWLTVAGSVFILEIQKDTAKAQEKLEDWLRYGLPTPEQDAIGWEKSPCLREHGYGEVVMDWQPLDRSANDQKESGK